MAIIGMFFQDGLTGSAWGDWANYTASPFFSLNSFFEIGKLLLEVPSHTVKTYGKGAGKGSSSSSRTPWSALQPRPLHLFSDDQDQILDQISLNQVNAKAKGFFLAAGKDAEHFLNITSNQPLGMIVPSSAIFRTKLQEAKFSIVERQIALFDPAIEMTTPRMVFLVSIGANVKIRDSQPDVSFQPPPQLAELAVDIDLQKIESKLQFEFAKDFKASFKQCVGAAIGSKNLQQVYSITKRDQVVSGLIKIQKVHLEQILTRSGPDGLYFKEKVRAGHQVVFPVALIHNSQLKDDIDKVLEHICKDDSFCGVHRSTSGSLSLHFRPDGIAKARKDLCQEGFFTEFNKSIVATKFFQVQGFPTGTSGVAAAEALHEWGWDVVPIKSWALSPWMQCWLVGTVSEPPGDYICIQDHMVTIVPDGMKSAKQSSKKEDLVFSQDPWSKYLTTASLKASAVADPTQPKPAVPAPKVQQVVADRIQSSESSCFVKSHRDHRYTSRANAARNCCLKATAAKR